MGGIAGIHGGERSPQDDTLARMLRAPAAAGRLVRAARTASVAVFGARDCDLAEDLERGELVAVCGYVRQGGAPASAAAILDAWREHGEQLLDSLGGEFALVVRCRGRLAVMRDALGTRPLYVAELPDGATAFGTSMFSLLHAGAPPDIDFDAVARSLVLGYPTAPGTALARVRQLGPGEIWQLVPHAVRRRWFCPRERLDRRRTLEASAETVDATLRSAVRDAIPPGERVGAFLSGGLDSSIVLAHLRESGTPVEAFTLFFGDQVPGEMRYARAVAQHLGVRHNVLEVDAKAFCAGIEPSVLHLEDVVSEAIAVPNFLLAREAARSADALFTGEGGDQSFGGPKNVGMALAYAYAGHPAAPPLAHTYVSLHHYLWSDLGEALHPRVLEAFDPERLAAEVGGRFFAGAYASKGRSFVGRVMLGNTVVKGGSNILVKAAKMIGLAHDLALRSPMFDRRLVDLAFTIPPWQKADGTDEKLVLRRAALRSLPAWVVNRPKRGMTLPLASWFAGELGELARDVLTERAVRQRGLLNWSYVERLLAARPTTQEHRRARTADKLWLALVTELHHRAIDTVARDARGRPDVRASTRAPGEAAHA